MRAVDRAGSSGCSPRSWPGRCAGASPATSNGCGTTSSHPQPEGAGLPVDSWASTAGDGYGVIAWLTCRRPPRPIVSHEVRRAGEVVGATSNKAVRQVARLVEYDNEA